MKTGFTLIELLAVIVILAIIALIATPIVLNIINDTKESAILRSADFYLDGVEKSIATSVLKGITITDGRYSIMQDGNICIGTLSNNTCTGDILKVEIDGEVPNSGTIIITNGQISDIILKLNGKIIVKNDKGELVFGQLTPGLYDENDNLIYTWEDLINGDYIPDSLYEYDEDDEEYEITEAYLPILNVTKNGTLSSIFDERGDINLSAEFLAGKLVLDKSVTSIGYRAFSGCTSLTSIEILDSVTSIEDGAFSGCTSLTSITIPDSVTSIGGDAFNYSGLASITIGSGVTSISDSAFNECPNLSQIIVDKNNPKYDSRNNSNAIIETATNTLIRGSKNTVIPSSVTSIGYRAFSGCTSLKSITIPDSVTSIGDDAFSNCTSLTSIIIPDSVTSIGDCAFYDCTSLTSITIPDSVTEIGGEVFSDCTSLTEVIIPDSVTSIGYRGFSGCTSLTSITIPESVISIGDAAFGSCTNLTSAKILNSEIIMENAPFEGCNNLTTIYFKGTADVESWGAYNATIERDF